MADRETAQPRRRVFLSRDLPRPASRVSGRDGELPAISSSRRSGREQAGHRQGESARAAAAETDQEEVTRDKGRVTGKDEKTNNAILLRAFRIEMVYIDFVLSL